VPPSWLGGWLDPELEELFHEDPDLARTATLLRASRPEAHADSAFRSRLRSSLMAEAARSRKRRWLISPISLAWAGVAVGVTAIAATALTLLSTPRGDHQTLVALSNVSAQHSVSPDDVITVSFNQPMDEQAVVAGLHIQPATRVTTAWRGNNLVITPVHHLTGNTPYTVTIPQSAARTASGSTARAAIQITFGTAPTPPASVVKPPTLAPVTVGTASPGAELLFAPDGSLLVTSATNPAAAAATATPSPTAASATPSGSPAVSSQSAVVYPADGGAPIVLGPAATAAAFSPNGDLVALAIPDQSGSDLLVVASSGGSPATLTHSAAAVTSLAWSSNQRVVYAAGTTVRSVDLSGLARTIAEPAGATSVELAPGGRYAYVSGGASGVVLLDLQRGTQQSVAGASVRAFSGDGSTAAWVDRSPNGALRLETQALGGSPVVPISLFDPSGSVSSLALNGNATAAAYVEQPAGGSPQTVVSSIPSGAIEAVGEGGSALAFSPDGLRLAMLGAPDSAPPVQEARVPGAAAAARPVGVPAAARAAVEAFVAAQVAGSASTMASLSVPAAAVASQTPDGLSRGYVISTAANPDGTVTATAELIVDPTSRHPRPSTDDETLTLTRSSDGASFLVTSLQSAGLHEERPGPRVVGVTSIVAHGQPVVQISFDSDLDRTTITQAIGLFDAAGNAIGAQVSYDAESRTATLTLTGTAPQGPITVSVSTGLRDVDGQSLTADFSTPTSF
jgi:hypothetical protein